MSSQTFDLPNDLKERFDYAVIFYQSAWEYEPDGMIDDHTTRDLTAEEETMVRISETLAASVSTVPPWQKIATEALIAVVGPGKYDACMVAAFQNVASKSFPNTASEFIESLNMYMRSAIKGGR